MTSEEKLARLALLVEGMAAQRNDALARGAAVHLLTSDSVVATLRGVLNGADAAGEGATDRSGDVAGAAIRGGAAYAVGAIGYSYKVKP